MNKLLLLITCIIVFNNCIFSQKISATGKQKDSSKKIYFIDNDKIKYSIVIMSCDSCIPISNIGYRVKVQLSKNEMEIVKKLDYKNWIILLQNNKTDWAANLILYYINDRDASLLARRNKRELWVKYLKLDDIKYWEKAL